METQIAGPLDKLKLPDEHWFEPRAFDCHPGCRRLQSEKAVSPRLLVSKSLPFLGR
jgi:hypothetical protein